MALKDFCLTDGMKNASHGEIGFVGCLVEVVPSQPIQNKGMHIIKINRLFDSLQNLCFLNTLSIDGKFFHFEPHC